MCLSSSMNSTMSSVDSQEMLMMSLCVNIQLVYTVPMSLHVDPSIVWFLTGIDHVDYTLYPKKEFQLKYLCMYLEETAILKGLYN